MPPASALGAGGMAGLSNEDLDEAGLDELFSLQGRVAGRILKLLGQAGRQETFRDDGATSLETWTVERFGVAAPTARAYAHIAEKAWDLPQLVGALCEGDITFDKLRAVVDMATPETDSQLCDQAKECTVRELADIARSTAKRAAGPPARSDHDRRFLRFNDQLRTVTVQLPAEAYAETRTCLDAHLREIPSDGETPLDQRQCDAFMGMIHSSGDQATKTGRPYFVVAHVPLAALGEESGESTELAGELEQHGMIDRDTVQRIACDATVAVAVDDDVGHTMYEGRARRFPTGAQRREVMRRDRHCRFPACPNVTFTNVHHLVPWKTGGPTDLDNLCLICLHHHALVHSNGWTMSGNANEELSFVGPSGRVMMSRPSALWTAATTGPAATPAAGQPKGGAAPKG